MLTHELCRYEDHTITARIAAALVVARIDFDYRGEEGEDAAIFVRPADIKQANFELTGARDYTREIETT